MMNIAVIIRNGVSIHEQKPGEKCLSLKVFKKVQASLRQQCYYGSAIYVKENN